MEIFSEDHDNVSVRDWDTIVEITLNLELGPETTEAIQSLSIPALRALVAHSEQIATRLYHLKTEALAQLEWLEN
jgi:hypothetical protein